MVTTSPWRNQCHHPVAGAWIESVPLMVISGQVKRSDLLGEPRSARRVSGWTLFTACEIHYEICGHCAKPPDIPGILEEVLQATDGRAGPVWIDVPWMFRGLVAPPLPLPKTARRIALSSEAFERIPKALHTPNAPRFCRTWGSGFLAQPEPFSMGGVSGYSRRHHLECPGSFDAHLNVGRPGVVALRT